MRLLISTRPFLIATTLLATVGVTVWCVRAVDFSDTNVTCLLNVGNVDAQFEDAAARELPGQKPMSKAQLYHMFEDTARFHVHYPRYCHRRGLDKHNAEELFVWAVAAEKYSRENVDVQVDPVVWRAFLADGPKTLPTYWEVRRYLSDKGADRGTIRGDDPFSGMTGDKRAVYKLPRLSTPYNPLPGEATPV